MIDEIISELKNIAEFKSVDYAPEMKEIDIQESRLPMAMLMYGDSGYTESATATEVTEQEKARQILVYVVADAREVFVLEDKADNLLQGFSPSEEYSPLEPVKAFNKDIRSSVYQRVIVFETRTHLISS